MSWPNLFTLLRLILTPIFIILLTNSHTTLATLIFLLAGMTDAIDGFLARKLNQKSRLGACLDPIADKLLLSSAFILLAWYGYLPSWLAIVVLSRDVFILLGALLLFLFSMPFEVHPSLLGKLTTFIQVLTILATLISTQITAVITLKIVLIYLTLIFTIFSGIQYGIWGYQIVR